MESLREEITTAMKEGIDLWDWLEIKKGDWIAPKGRFPYGQVIGDCVLPTESKDPAYLVELPNGEEIIIKKSVAELVNRKGFIVDDLPEIWISIRLDA